MTGTRAKARAWTPEQDAELEGMAGSGMSIAEIALRCNRTPAAAAQRLSRLRCRTAGRWGGIGWTDEDNEYLLDAVKCHISHKQIGLKLGRSTAAVTKRLAWIRRSRPEPEPIFDPRRCRAIRSCLGCGKSFRSAHAGNRMCQACLSREIMAGC